MEARAEYVTVADPMDSPGKPGTSSSYNSSSNVSVDFGMYGNSLYVPKTGFKLLLHVKVLYDKS